jgi:hypothetical protein
MRKFLIQGGRYGGEVTVGKVTKEFVEYWLPKVEEDGDSELIDHLVSLGWNDDEVDSDSPDLTENGNVPWHDVDDIEHHNGYYADGGFVVEEQDNPDAEQIDVSGFLLYSREAYANDCIPEPSDHITEEDIKKYVPVMSFHSSEKGSFGAWELEIDEDFDSYKLAYSVLETNCGEFIDRVWYDGKELECNFDWNDSIGKGYYVSLGYMNPRWHDPSDRYTEEYINENGFWEELKENVKWEKENSGN